MTVQDIEEVFLSENVEVDYFDEAFEDLKREQQEITRESLKPFDNDQTN